MTQAPERLQKLLARAGYGSRREIERWIEEGVVTLNGRVAVLGDTATPEDSIEVRGKPMPVKAVEHFKPRTILYHKPIGEVSTQSDPEGRPTVFDHLPPMRTSRWVIVGRLDVNTVGLLLFTNDGELANKLMHPATGIEREYMVRVLGEAGPEVLARLQQGVELEDGPAHFDSVKPEGGEGVNRWYRVMLKEGRKREVRRLWESQGFTVSRLIRVRYGPIGLERALRPGRWRELKPEEIRALYAAAGLTPPAGPEPARPGRPTRRPPSTARRGSQRGRGLRR